MGVCHVGQAGLKLLTSGDASTSAFQSVEITGMSHCARPFCFFFFLPSSFFLFLPSFLLFLSFVSFLLCLSFFFIRRGFTTLVRLVLNSLPQVICPPWPPKCLDYRREPQRPALVQFLCQENFLGCWWVRLSAQAANTARFCA